ncbi:MAG: hypothetical protein ABL989_03500 [Gammaproteobacteria bacterium]
MARTATPAAVTLLEDVDDTSPLENDQDYEHDADNRDEPVTTSRQAIHALGDVGKLAVGE